MTEPPPSPPLSRKGGKSLRYLEKYKKKLIYDMVRLAVMNTFGGDEQQLNLRMNPRRRDFREKAQDIEAVLEGYNAGHDRAAVIAHIDILKEMLGHHTAYDHRKPDPLAEEELRRAENTEWRARTLGDDRPLAAVGPRHRLDARNEVEEPSDEPPSD